MKNLLCAGIVMLLTACNNAGEPVETSSTASPDTVVINTDTTNGSRVDGTSIDAGVLDTTIQ